MENASKALLISAGVLLAILLLSLFAYLMRQMGASTSGIYSTLSQHEISEFNQKFLNYEGRENLSIQDVITIVNLAKDNNEKANRPTIIEVKVDELDWSNKTTADLNDLLKQKIDLTYSCTKVETDYSSLLVKKIIIKTNYN